MNTNDRFAFEQQIRRDLRSIRRLNIALAVLPWVAVAAVLVAVVWGMVR